MPRNFLIGLTAFAAAIASPVSAEVINTNATGFVTRDEAVVEADTKAVWLALITPATWWNSAHTWSGDAANLTMKPQAGGCFCETIPEDPDPEVISFVGSVEHMRVIQAFPERALRMRGGLGPLQSEPATGVLTIALTELEDGNTRIVWEYVVGGPMRFEIPQIAMAVDGVMSEQLAGLAKQLGPVSGAGSKAEKETEASPMSAKEEALVGEMEAAAERADQEAADPVEEAADEVETESEESSKTDAADDEGDDFDDAFDNLKDGPA